MTRRRLPLLLAAGLLAAGLAGCRRQPPAPEANPHYVLEAPYQAGGAWYYPAETFGLTQTGIAAVADKDHAPLTADGEAYDPTSLAAAHQTSQLPAVARVTNLENGRQIEVRVNDRGPDSPSRLVALTPRAAELLAMTGPARVRVEFLPGPSHEIADALGGGPRVEIAAAPRDDIEATDLPPPGAEGGAGKTRLIGAAAQEQAASAAPGRMPEVVTQGYAEPGELEIQASTFSSYAPANRQRSLLGGLGARVDQERVGRQTRYTVRLGPFATIADADATLDRILRSGDAPEARIVVE